MSILGPETVLASPDPNLMPNTKQIVPQYFMPNLFPEEQADGIFWARCLSILLLETSS